MIQFLVALALCFVLVKIPFWVLGSLRGGGGRSLVGTVVRAVAAYKTFGLIGAGRSAAESARPRRARKSEAVGDTDPYANTRATSHGQYMLPLQGLKRGRLPKPPHQRYAPKPHPRRSRSAQQGTQLALPMDGEWPENKPRLGRDGQYQLPLDVTRQPKPKPAPQPPPEPRSSTPHGRQLRLPADGEWPENKPRVGRDGQYRLPLNVQRTRKPDRKPPEDPPPQPRRGPRPRQQQLRLNLPKRCPGGERDERPDSR